MAASEGTSSSKSLTRQRDSDISIRAANSSLVLDVRALAWEALVVRCFSAAVVVRSTWRWRMASVLGTKLHGVP